ncbi:MAG: BON domain-containing protein [Alphaproteobacteria bacterium]|jgi:osmotically-inducible protein OsmY
MPRFGLFALLVFAPLLTGCVAAATTAATQVGIATADKRSYGTSLDDTIIYTAINEKFLNADVNDLLINATINVRQGRVLLTGNVNSETTAQRATELAWQVKGVEEVINEIVVIPDTEVWDTANDIAIKKNLETRLLLTKGVFVIDYSIDVVNGTAYLLGYCHSQTEMDKALNVARTTRGVRRVINHLRILPPVDSTQGMPR